MRNGLPKRVYQFSPLDCFVKTNGRVEANAPFSLIPARRCDTLPAMPAAPEIAIRRLEEDDAVAAAHLMADTDPWITLGRTFQDTLKTVRHAAWETHVATHQTHVIGVILLGINIPLIKGYVGALAVHRDHRNAGVGAALLRFAEQRIFTVSPNVFLCVSSFNTEAQRFYERNGYSRVGDLTDYSLAGHSEILLRKTIGPWSTFTPAPAPAT
jgi:ribosomal-protein-alanine N-acetyltransferase